MIHLPFLVVVTFKNGKVIYLRETTRSRAKSIAQHYKKMDTVKDAEAFVVLELADD